MVEASLCASSNYISEEEYKMYDIVIIGAGVAGAFIGRELSRYHLQVLMLDRQNDVGNETTAAKRINLY